MGKASVIQSTFSAGELSPKLEGRVDLAKYSNGAKLIENFLLSVQGPAIRRGGTRFVAPVKNSANRSWLLRFEFNTTQAYVLEFGDFYIRFYANHGQVVTSGVAAYNGATAYIIGDLAASGGITYYAIAPTTGNAPPNATYWYPLTGSIYEIPSPYSAADLTDTDGTLKLRFAQSGDVIFIAHPDHQPGKLSRFGATTWTLTQVSNVAGPFADINITNTTVYASADTGSVTLTASTNVFQAGHVGSLLYLQQQDVSTLSQWTSATAFGAGATARSAGVNYKTVAGGTSGGTKPTHSYGTAQDGSPGIAWAYHDPGYGFLRITAYTSPTQVTATVVGNDLPAGTVGGANASRRWAFGAWSGVNGYPSQVSFFKERLIFAADQNVWMSVTGDYENFDGKDPLGQVAADGAVSITVVARKVNKIEWLEPGVDLLIGTAGGEFRCKAMTDNQVFGPGNVTVQPQSEYGSRSMAPQRIGASVVYVQRSGRKVREMAYDFGPDNYKSTDLTVLSEHITQSGLVASDYQQEPYSMLWYARADGVLLGFTFNREQDVVGWARHPIGGSGIVESLCCIPSPDGGRNELWMIVRRTINGATARYVEYMEVEHQVGDDIEQAFYVDSGLTYDGAVAVTLQPGAGANVNGTLGVTFTAGGTPFVLGDVGRFIHYRYLLTTADDNGVETSTWTSAKAEITGFTDTAHVTATITSAFPDLSLIAAGDWRMTTLTITGLSHLEGETVDVLNNGASHPQRVVAGGQITLQYPGSVVQVGEPCPCRLQTMRLNAGAQDGTSQGKTARINKLNIRFLESLGAQYGVNSKATDILDFRSTGDAMDQPPPLFTGDKLVEFDGDYDTDPWVYVQNDQPFPTTIVALCPQVRVYDR